MRTTPPGPDFERSPDQRIIPGAYEAPAPRATSSTTVTLLDRLRAALRPSGKRRRGPGFRKPQAWAPWPPADKRMGTPTNGRRPNGYELPGVEDAPEVL